MGGETGECANCGSAFVRGSDLFCNKCGNRVGLRVAVMTHAGAREQLRAGASVRDCLHLSPGRHAFMGRETGDWTIPYDPAMSGRHAETVSEDIEFFVNDAGSRDGVAMAVRGDRELKPGQRFLLGDQLLRAENV